MSLNAGINGMKAYGDRMGSISHNIANMTTEGFKQQTPIFQELVLNSQSIPLHSYNGAQVVQRHAVSSQGQLLRTDSTTDLAISGHGMFVVSADADAMERPYYTRAGAFTTDMNGDLKNTAGYFLQGWRLDASGNLSGDLSGQSVAGSAGLSRLETINIPQMDTDFTATSSISPQANLKASQAAYTGLYNPADPANNMASGAIAPHFFRTIEVSDSSGAAQNLHVGFLKIANNSWATEIYAEASDVSGGNPLLASGTISFNGDGTLAAVSSGLSVPVGVTWQSGSATNQISFNWGTAGVAFGTPGAVLIGRADGLSQFDAAYRVVNIPQDGHVIGKLDKVEIDKDGYVTGNYSNGTTQRLYKIPLASFLDPNMLDSATGDVFYESERSSEMLFVQADGENGGRIQTNALEQSNVDLSTQFTDIIVSQRAYQSNSKLISTDDNMLEAAVNMVR
jgi:flagellar hook protein FlgE